MAFASKEIIGYLNKVKPPYNISEPVQELALKALDEVGQVNDMIRELVSSRELVKTELLLLSEVLEVYPSDANFLLVKFKDAKAMYEHLIMNAIVVRDRSNVILCDECLRITIGTEQENSVLLDSIKSYSINLK
jgi:histidinol-phosphate aminotransferase